MKIKDLKITTKLVISVATFLLPLAIMLFSIISVSLQTIRKERNELNGIYTLKTAISLAQVIPQYILFTIDNFQGDIETAKNTASDLLITFQEKCTSYFKEDISMVTINKIKDNWEHIISDNPKTKDSIIWANKEIMNNLTQIISYVADISGLITDNELESSYLIAATVHELPVAQQRLSSILNITRSLENGVLPERKREELLLELALLRYSDNSRIMNRFNSIEYFKMKNTKSTESFESFEYLLRNCYNRIESFSKSAEEIFAGREVNVFSLPVLHEYSRQANNAIYTLQDASLERLNDLITQRIKVIRNRLIYSLLAAIFATLISSFIITATILYIRKTTVNILNVFNNLSNNDLSVKLNTTSTDEMGAIIKALDDFLSKLNMDFISFYKSANMVSAGAIELSTSAMEVSATANQQSASISEIVTTMDNNKELSAQAAEKTLEVAELATKTQELSTKGAALRDVNEDMMLDILNQNTKIIDIIKNLADMLSRIDESIQIIDNIADRTKLIAFNAALEASSTTGSFAGNSAESGARFSVVAGEIRRFADNVVESVSEIKEKITELQDASKMLTTEAKNGTKAINTGYQKMIEQKEVFKKIVEVSDNVAIRSNQISSLSKQQELASAQVFTALKEISTGVSHFAAATDVTKTTIDKLNTMSVELEETLAKYKTTIRSNS